jgi:hypothetical protein
MYAMGVFYIDANDMPSSPKINTGLKLLVNQYDAKIEIKERC